MNTREQFGNYLLLKKLTEDSLGETFRAGLLGAKGMERVALLRIFNGQGIDGMRLWEATRERLEVQKVLRSPNIGEGVEMGEIQGIPYVAYDYVSGKNLATLLEQAAKKRNFISAEHALLITERIAQALAVAAENRINGQRILHGFLVPRLVMISNEGETRLLGFEVAPGLRGFAANPVIRQHFGRYLAPEALTGTPPHKGDDIYSLGVVLFELLTGRPLPAPAADGYSSVIDAGVLATDGQPIPADLGQLLKKSLVPRDQRIDDIVAWHKTLNQWMIDGQYNPTTFNLAFFMHNLFRQEIERESQEIEVEKTLPVPVVQQSEDSAAAPSGAASADAAATVAVQTPAARPVDENTGVISDATESFIPEYARDDADKSNTGLFIGIAAAVVVLVATAIFMMISGGKAPEQAAVQTSPPTVPAEPEPPPGPSEEEIQAQIAQMEALINQKASEMAENLRADQEAQLEDLRRQLDDAKKAADRRRELEKQRQEQLARQQEEAEAAAKAEEEANAAAEAAATAEAAKAERPAPEPEPAPVKETESTAAESTAAESTAAEAAKPPPEAPKPIAVPPPSTAPKPVRAAPATTQVRRGDLVEMGPGVSAPKALRISPRFPEMARRVKKSEATVQVKVLVDENGKALKAELVGEKVGFGFDNEALQAAKKAVYRPATKNGVPVKIWYTINVEFRL